MIMMLMSWSGNSATSLPNLRTVHVVVLHGLLPKKMELMDKREDCKNTWLQKSDGKLPFVKGVYRPQPQTWMNCAAR